MEGHPPHTMPLGLGISYITGLLFKYLEWWLLHWCLDYRALLNRYLCWCVEGEVGGVSSVWGQVPGTSVGGMKLCMVPCHSCHTYRIWRSKGVGDDLKSSFKVATQATKRGEIFWGKAGRGCSPCNTAVSKFSFPTGHCKRSYRIPVFTMLLLFYLFCIY